MQFEVAERVAQDQLESFRHQAAAQAGRKTVVAEVRALEEPARDLTQVVDADERSVVAPCDEEASLRCGARANQIRVVLARRLRCIHPGAVQPAARAREPNELVAVRVAGSPEADALSCFNRATHETLGLRG